ncbi:MAG: pilus assembly protein [Proteobacteria bacterium]|nr:pilus assembly protein [Pseudomonadota bacterium]
MELALVLPVLLAMVLGVIDFGRALQFNNVLVGMAREAANLAARTSDDPAYIITAINDASAPLDMPTSGMIFLTTVVGRADGSGTVTAQSRAVSGKAGISSRIYTCPGWAGGGICNVPAPAPVVRLSVALETGEVVHVAEVLYDFDPIVGYVMNGTKQLYSLALL